MTRTVNIGKILGKNIRRLRRARNLTQDELAELLGISVISLSRMENNRAWPRKDVFQNMVKVLNARPFEFFLENVTDVDYYKDLIISAFADEIDDKFPTDKKAQESKYSTTHKDTRKSLDETS